MNDENGTLTNVILRTVFAGILYSKSDREVSKISFLRHFSASMAI